MKLDRVAWRERFFLVNVGLPILSGALTYIFFRASSLYVFQWLESFYLLSPVIELREQSLSLASSIPHVILYSLPDLFWVYAGTSYFYSIWVNQSGLTATLWINTCLVLALGAEVLQYFKAIEGTFDIVDVLMYVLGYTLAILNMQLLQKEKKNA